MRVPVLGLVALMVAGCGGTSPLAGADESFQVGAIVTQTGVNAVLGDDMETAMRLYLDDHRGLLGGRPARLVVADDAGSEETGREQARKLIDGGADVLTGLLSAPVAAAVVREAAGTPVVLADAGTDGLAAFRTSYTNHAQGYAAGRYAAEHYPGRDVVLMAPDRPEGAETLDGFTDGYGSKPVERVLTPPGPEPYLGGINGRAGLVFACYAGGEAVAFVRAYRRGGIGVPLLGGQGLGDEDVLRAVGRDAEGLVSVGVYAAALDNAANVAFVARWRAATGRDPSAVALQGWDTMRFVDRAVAAGGDLTRALAAVRELDGPRGTFRWDAERNPVQNWYAREYRNGVNRIIATIPPS
ncbi:MAG: ABC transporter substrate-binding protein [Nonomuraea sp.]|nr:ABC transporter substrate-binding protein [Nonomuraea sp.]